MAALHGHSRGSSVVEFAIVMPLFIALVYGAMFLTEVGNYKLKAQEIARFGAFAFSNYELSGFDTPKLEHERSWKAARTGVGTQLTNLYSDLDAARIGYGSNPGGLLMKADYVPEAASNVFAPSLTNRQMEIIPAALNAQLASH